MDSQSIRNTGVCVRCGGEAAYLVGGVPVCDECYTVYGSCCMEFGADDLWKITETGESGPSADTTR